MAILVEEEKAKSGNALTAVAWIATILIIVAAGYYLFLATPSAVTVTPPQSFLAIQPLATISVTPQDVANLSSFKSLTSAAAQPSTSTPGNVGRSNPFIAP